MRYRYDYFDCRIVILVACFIFCVGDAKLGFSYCCPPDIDGISRVAGDMLERNRLFYLDRTLPILSTSFVNLDDLKETSAFGRLMGVRVASRFSQHGYRVVELRLGKGSLIIQEKKGEFVLSRETARLDGCYDAQAIIVGTYSLDDNCAFVSVRLVSILDNTLISSYDFTIRMDDTLKRLAGKKTDVVTAMQSVEVSDINENQDAASAASSKGKINPISSGSVLLKLSNPLAAKIVQAQLSRLGFYTWKVDGIWKTRSRNALVAFKRKNHLSNEARWDLETQLALFNPKP